MNGINFSTTKEETETISLIVQRAQASNPDINRLSLMMDISATHANGCPLKLDELLAAGDLDFRHDVYGIMFHLNRQTGKLGDMFVPRFASAVE